VTERICEREGPAFHPAVHPLDAVPSSNGDTSKSELVAFYRGLEPRRAVDDDTALVASCLPLRSARNASVLAVVWREEKRIWSTWFVSRSRVSARVELLGSIPGQRLARSTRRRPNHRLASATRFGEPPLAGCE